VSRRPQEGAKIPRFVSLEPRKVLGQTKILWLSPNIYHKQNPSPRRSRLLHWPQEDPNKGSWDWLLHGRRRAKTRKVSRAISNRRKTLYLSVTEFGEARRDMQKTAIREREGYRKGSQRELVLIETWPWSGQGGRSSWGRDGVKEKRREDRAGGQSRRLLGG